ncbi:MAG: SRPBCC family protein [Candidatus Sulfotelmatobacter sp.]
MLVVKKQVAIEGQLNYVFQCSWDFDLLCAFNPNVRRVEVLQSTDKVQRFQIEEEFSGAVCGYVAERTASSPNQIRYRQTQPLAFLKSHEASWSFHPQGENVVVESEERFDVDMDRASTMLPLGTREEEDVEKMLSFSTHDMLMNLKAYVELLQQPVAVV